MPRLRHPALLLVPAAALALTLGCKGEVEFQEFDETDIFYQNPWKDVDVVLVVDNSCSMEPFQTKLAQDFGSFFEFFDDGNTDWQIGVVSTDPFVEPGVFRGPVITRDTSDPQSVFAEVVAVGTEGSGLEAGLQTGLDAVTGANAGFPRESATLSVIFVSDEEDISPGSVADYVDAYYGVKGHRAKDAFNASALTVTSKAECSAEQYGYSSPGERYVGVAERTGGVVANLCEQDFAGIVTELAITTSAVRDTFYLRDRPRPETLIVDVGEVADVPCEGVWSYQLVADEDGAIEPAIVFEADAIPDSDQRIVAHYTRGDGQPLGECSRE